MSNFLIALAVFIITVVGALFAVPYFIDWNGYRGVFEEEATRLLGREVRVGGAVNLHLLPTPYFRFEKVRIADTSANLEDAFFRADSLTVKLTVAPLLRGAVEANEIEFQRPVLRLGANEKGVWNWQSFGQALGNANYLPTNVALTSLKITDGVLALHGTNGAERSRLEGLNAELSTPALDGPYRFRGVFGKAGAERELRIATARPEESGGVRFKASLRAADTGSVYTLEALLADIMGAPRIEGELTARLPITGLWQKARLPGRPSLLQKGAGDEDPKIDRSEAAFDLKAAVTANATGAVLSNLALSFEQDGQPQLATGEVKADWRDALTVDLSLSSRWLDLDRIAGASEGAAPLDSIVPIAMRLRDLLPEDGRSRATFSVDQANIGREAISGLRLAIARTKDKLEVQELRLGMPGGSRGDLKGVMSGSGDAPVFEGTLGLRGTSLVRFAGWASGNALPADARGDGSFGIRTQLSIRPARVALRDIVGDVSGTAIYGAAQYRWDGRPELTLTLEGPQLDARAFVPAGASLGDVIDVVLHGPASGRAATPGLSPSKAGWRGAQTDALVRVNTGQLMTAGRTYRDVVAELELRGGHLRLPLLRLAGDDGFSLELEGDVVDAATRPKGGIRAVGSAESASGVTALAELLGIPEILRPGDRRASALAPLRLAGALSFGGRGGTSTDVALDGEANGTTVRLNGRFDGAQAGWRAGPAEITASVEGADASKIAALLVPGASGRSEGAGRMLVKASGIPSEGLATLASVEAGEMALGFRGQLVLAEGATKVSGDLDIKVSDGARLAALAGLAPPLRLEGMPLAGSLALSVAGSAITMDKMALKIGGSDVRGQVMLAPAGERRRVEAQLSLEELSLARLLAPLLDQRLAVAAAAEAAISGRQGILPDEPFDAAVLDAFEGSIKITAKRLALAEGIGLSRPSIDVALSGGRIEVKQIEGAGLGGRVSATLRIDKVPAGADVAGTLRLSGGSIEALAGDRGGPAQPGGPVSAVIEFSGKGTSPRNVLSLLQGSGSAELGDIKLGTLWPGAIALASDAAITAEPDKLAATVRQALAAGLSKGPLPIGPSTVALEIADGQLRIKPLGVETPEGRATGGASVDFKSLTFESEWRLEAKPVAGTADKPIPAITVAYKGPLTSIGKLEPRIGSEALERELSVRRMERDLEELERLRKLDESRRRSESDRLRQQLAPQQPPPSPVPAPTGSGAPRAPAAPG